MKTIFKIFTILSLFLIFSCQKDVDNIQVYGIIKDIELNSPIEGSSVKIICWKYLESPDQSYAGKEIKEVLTDKDGRYSLAFDKGAFVEIKIKAIGYIEEYSVYYISKSKNELNFELKHN